MLKIFKDLYFHFILKIAALFSLLFIFIYGILQINVLDKSMQWFLIAVGFVAIFGIIAFMTYRLHKKLTEDIEALSEYLKKIDAKEYDAEIKIMHYIDFLEHSLLLKNLVKRVYQKEKKAAKN